MSFSENGKFACGPAMSVIVQYAQNYTSLAGNTNIVQFCPKFITAKCTALEKDLSAI